MEYVYLLGQDFIISVRLDNTFLIHLIHIKRTFTQKIDDDIYNFQRFFTKFSELRNLSKFNFVR